MSMDEDADLNLSIPVKSFIDEFICPICFAYIKECYITPCGHNFCKECIHECINRKHVCPCCNHATVKTQLVKNHLYDNLLKAINAEKDASSKKYFESLISSSISGTNTTTSSNEVGSPQIAAAKSLSPIEELFHRHMKKGLSAYEDYYKDIKSKFEKNQQKIKEGYLKRMQELKNKSEDSTKEAKKKKGTKKSKSEIDVQIAQLAEECENTVRQLSVSFDRSVDLLLKSYDQYLTENVPKPSFLPVSVSVLLKAQGITIDNITIRSTDNIKDLREMLEKRLKDLGNPVTSFPEKILITIRRPFSAEVDLKSKKKKSEKTEKSEDSETIVVDNEDIPLLQYKLEPGSVIEIGGELKLKSDQPQQCFTATFEKDKGQVVDYYTCKDCKINWICKPCAENCHKGHSIVDYVMNHKPTWNCCYCVKNKKCKLPNSRKK